METASIESNQVSHVTINKKTSDTIRQRGISFFAEELTAHIWRHFLFINNAAGVIQENESLYSTNTIVVCSKRLIVTENNVSRVYSSPRRWREHQSLH